MMFLIGMAIAGLHNVPASSFGCALNGVQYDNLHTDITSNVFLIQQKEYIWIPLSAPGAFIRI